MKLHRAEGLHSGAVMLLALAALLIVFAAFWFFRDRISDALNVLPITSPSEEFSGAADLILSFASMGIILFANLLWLPGAIVGHWGLLALTGLCVLAAGFLWFRARQRRER